MRMYDLILKKRQGKPLTKDEIQWMIREYTDGRIPDYQMSALLMAICFQGLDKEETYELTMAMARSGEMLDLSQIQGIKIDKHSTGGVGRPSGLSYQTRRGPPAHSLSPDMDCLKEHFFVGLHHNHTG